MCLFLQGHSVSVCPYCEYVFFSPRLLPCIDSLTQNKTLVLKVLSKDKNTKQHERSGTFLKYARIIFRHIKRHASLEKHKLKVKLEGGGGERGVVDQQTDGRITQGNGQVGL